MAGFDGFAEASLSGRSDRISTKRRAVGGRVGEGEELRALPAGGDEESADATRDFYDEYLAVMDLTAEFYLQTVDTVFIRHALPKGQMTHRGTPVDPRWTASSAAAP